MSLKRVTNNGYNEQILVRNIQVIELGGIIKWIYE